MSRHGALSTVLLFVIGVALSVTAAWMLRDHRWQSYAALAVGLALTAGMVVFTDAEIANAHSFGLIGMEERAREFGGVLRVESGKDRGTTVSVSLPY